MNRMDKNWVLHNGGGNLCARSLGRQDRQLNTYDWLADVPADKAHEVEYVEVQFKNTRKSYYRNVSGLDLRKGDIVAVEAQPGHDVGVVTLTGPLVALRMAKTNLKPDAMGRRVYRKAKATDLEKWEEAKAREHDTMIRARQIALGLKLEMKIGDVEYQGDGGKAIFYYIAEGRVDFRQLIKVLAEVFRVRIEMKQIGARQEAGRIGGIGPCGRELCCATWMTSFISVATAAARLQDIALNPQKLAGQCAKLKCCLNYEADIYVEAAKRMPSREIPLETADTTYYFLKADILAGRVTYSPQKGSLEGAVTLSARRALEVMDQNRRGMKPESLDDGVCAEKNTRPADLLEQDSLTRFDRNKGKSTARKKKKKNTVARADREATAAPMQSVPNDRPKREGKNKKKKQAKEE